jgi:formylmethanofuran dehydrogenase subunit C
MSVLTLTLREQPPHPLDCSELTPTRLQALSLKAIRSLPLEGGPEPVKLGDFFDIDGKSDGTALAIVNRGARLDFIGAGLESGSISVRGGAGRFAARGMRGGTLSIRGGAHDFLASGMRGGLVEVTGDVGDFCAGALPNEAFGLNGGTVIVNGNAGNRLGDRQRRGIVVVTGNAGDFTASRLFAGSVVVMGNAGQTTGLGMRRGTVLVCGEMESLPSTYGTSGRVELPFMGLFVRHLATHHKVCRPLLALGSFFERFCGDLGQGGTGEILRPVPATGGRRRAS